MGIQIAWCAFAVAILNAAVTAGAQPIKVFVHDHARVNQRALQKAETEASRILATGGIEVLWVNCRDSSNVPEGCGKTPDSTSLVVLLVGAGASRYGTEPGALGFAVPPEEAWFGSYAGVLFDRVERLTSPTLTTQVILGHAIAHELGHLLLGLGQHAPTGIMKAGWHRKELEMAKRGTLLFRDEERREIRENARRRLERDYGADVRTAGDVRVPVGNDRTMVPAIPEVSRRIFAIRAPKTGPSPSPDGSRETEIADYSPPPGANPESGEPKTHR